MKVQLGKTQKLNFNCYVDEPKVNTTPLTKKQNNKYFLKLRKKITIQLLWWFWGEEKTKEQPSGDLNDTKNTNEKSTKVTTDINTKPVKTNLKKKFFCDNVDDLQQSKRVSISSWWVWIKFNRQQRKNLNC